MEFFAKSNGKGAVDSIGGTVKQSGQRTVKTDKNHISDASEYASHLRSIVLKHPG